NQTQVEILVLQGERAMANDNVKLGQFTLDGLPPAPRGIPQIEVSFNIDVNGILNVSAKDKGTGKNQKITIQSSNLSKDDIERMKKDAESHEEEDKKKKESVEAKNEADSMIFTAEKVMSDLGDKMTPDEKGKVNIKIDALKKTIESGNISSINGAKEDLNKTLQEFSTRLYQSAGPETQPGDDIGGYQEQQKSESGDSDTVDAEFSDQGQA
ncbi:MAG: Hsp70 family protein, partial [Synergistaceae bacterium]|nr:Hsp70 family protein [Synergistaceae bacterium]